MLLLDTDVHENAADDRQITDRLYGGDDAYRLKQEIVLGIGGLRILQALGFHIRLYHLNEGHAALLALDLLRRYPRPDDQVLAGELRYDVAAVREQCVFTTHTPVEAGHDRFAYPLMERMLQGYIDTAQAQIVSGKDNLNMTRLALTLSGFINGVARRHAETTTRMFPGYKISAISNGVHLPTWAHEAFSQLFSDHFPAWAHEPEAMVRFDQLPDDGVWKAHREAKSDLVRLVGERTAVALDPEAPILGFARRMTAYKRPDLLFSDLERLRKINSQHRFQLVVAGKAHPGDGPGKCLIRRIHDHIAELQPDLRIAFLPNYDMTLAKTLVSGADIWLNTPEPPLEASGTSGMKAALNGVLNLSVLDGWWVEAVIEGVTGWAIGQDGGSGPAQASPQDFYQKLENVVLPLYHHDRGRWIWMMKQAISKIACYFNTMRMMRRYAAEAYLR